MHAPSQFTQNSVVWDVAKGTSGVYKARVFPHSLVTLQHQKEGVCSVWQGHRGQRWAMVDKTSILAQNF